MSDLIDRQAAIDADTLNCMVNCYEDLRDYFHGDDAILRDRREFKFWLERVKWHVLKCEELACELSNRPERKSGKWIEYPECLGYDGALFQGDIACSVCGAVFSSIDNCTERFNCCPNCGARMVSDNAERQD